MFERFGVPRSRGGMNNMCFALRLVRRFYYLIIVVITGSTVWYALRMRLVLFTFWNGVFYAFLPQVTTHPLLLLEHFEKPESHLFCRTRVQAGVLFR